MFIHLNAPLHAVLCVLLIAPFALLQTSAQPARKNAALHQLFEDYYEDRLKLFPLEATAQGDPRYNDQLPNSVSMSFIRQVNDFHKRYEKALQKFNYQQLTAADKISFDILMDIIHRHLEGERFHPEYMPVNQMFSLPLGMGQFGSGRGNQPFETVKDYENWLARITAFTVWVDTAIANFRKGVRAGVVLPAALVGKIIPQMESLAQSDSSKSIFYGPINRFPEAFSPREKRRLREAYDAAIQKELIPAYTRLAGFLQNEYLPKARPTSGLSSLPSGSDMYRYYVYFYTTTGKTPEELYDTGLREVERITSEITKIKNAIGFNGSVKELFESMRTDEKLMPFMTSAQVLKAYDTVRRKIEPHLEKYFGLKPRSAFEVREVEAFRAASAPAQYRRPSLDGSRPGVFYVPIVDPTKVSVAPIESVFIHEAIPGHHYQLSLQQENDTLPRFRRLAVVPVFSEGWALYVESLGELLGCYGDPYQKLGALNQEMRRAVRLVVDAAIHTGKMNREQAIAYMLAHEALSEQVATREVERYMAMPGQALSYKTGELKIMELRDKYTRQLGSKFSLKDFHDALLKGGSMPLTVCEKYMDQWAAGVR